MHSSSQTMSHAGQVILPAILQELFNRLASKEFLNFARQILGGVHSDLKALEKRLRIIEVLVRDAEAKQLITNPIVKMWLEDLQELANDVEDILNEFDYEAFRRKLMTEQMTTIGKVRKLILTCFFSSWSNVKIINNMQVISSRLEELYKLRSDLGLQVISEGRSSSAAAQNRPQQRPRGLSVPTESAFRGRKKAKSKILKMVSRDGPPSTPNFRIIAIVGTRGIGKTRLAREVYNDRRLSEDFQFENKTWVCVSNDFDVLRILKVFLESITGTPCNSNDLEVVTNELRNEVNQKKFLLVLDDVWNDNYESWLKLKDPLRHCARGSKIIMTTRKKEVEILDAGDFRSYELKRLPDDLCWELFLHHVGPSGLDVDSRSIRKRVLKKCGGLPLAAKILGGLLHFHDQIDAWKSILNYDAQESSDANYILPILRLSYQYLPLHLKRCLAYSANFPKGYEFEKEELILLWIAEGIIQRSENKEQLYLAGEYFRYLLLRSFFQQSSSNTCKYIMHTLVHDLAELVSNEIVGCAKLKANSKVFERPLHFSYTPDNHEEKNKYEVFDTFESQRTFLPEFMRDYYNHYFSVECLHRLFSSSRKLRILSLKGYEIKKIPDSIGNLIHLRYLNFSGTGIESLPKSICLLFCLQILILRDCSNLKKLPSKMRYLVNLRHLDIGGENKLKKMPRGIKELKYIETLSDFVVGKDKASKLTDLRNLNFLRGKFRISKLNNAPEPEHIGETILSNKKDLEVLFLEWEDQGDASRDEDREKNVLNKLQPHGNLKELVIKNYGGAQFPEWIEDRWTLSKINVLKLENCNKCTRFPQLGQLRSLKHLTIKEMTELRAICIEESRLQPFPALQILCFENLENWMAWETITEDGAVEIFPTLSQIFPTLSKLSIVNCPRLTDRVPPEIPSFRVHFHQGGSVTIENDLT